MKYLVKDVNHIQFPDPNKFPALIQEGNSSCA